MHNPTEHVQEHLQHTAAHGEHHDEGGHDHHGGRWITAAALTAAILAAFAAVSGALSNSHLTESTHRRIDANDQWSYYQSDKIKSSEIDTRMYMATLSHVPPAKKDVAKKAEYDEGLPKTKDRADALTKISDQHVEAHETYEAAETLFHISIAIVAIAVVAKRRSFWYVSMATGLVGLVLFGKAITQHINPEPEIAAQTSTTAPENAAAKGAEKGSEKGTEKGELPHAKPADSHPASEPAG